MLSRAEKNKKRNKKIKNEERRKKRKQKLLSTLKVLLGIIIIIGSIVSYIYYVSTSQLIVREYSYSYSKLPENFNGLKIIQIGDLYYDKNYKFILKELKTKIDKIKPDLIFFTGGLFNKNYNANSNDYTVVSNFFDSIDASIGKYFVIGSNDDKKSVELLEKTHFKFLDNISEEIFVNTPTPINIYGINEKSSKDALKNTDGFKIVLVNNPTNIDEIINSLSPDIIMAGKTLNGQIRIPFTDLNILNKDYKYFDSYYKVNNTDLFITGGIGTNNIPIRIFNHPNINFYRLKK